MRASRGSTSSSSPSASSSCPGGGDGSSIFDFDVGQRRGHDEVFGREIQMHELHHCELLEILLGDAGVRNLQDVELVLVTGVQQEVERPLELGELQGPRGCASVVRLAVGHDEGGHLMQRGRGGATGAWGRLPRRA